MYDQGMANFLNQRGQNAQVSMSNAGNQTQASIASAGNMTNASLQNAANDWRRLAANQGVGMDAQRFNIGNDFNRQMFNVGNDMDAQRFNIGNDMNSQMFNIGNDMNSQMFNIGNMMDADRFNIGNDMNSQMFNIGNDLSRQQGNQRHLANAWGRAPGMFSSFSNSQYAPYNMMMGIGNQQQGQAQQMINGAMNQWNYYRDLPLNMLNSYNNIVGSQSGTGQVTTNSQPANWGGALAGFGNTLANMDWGNNSAQFPTSGYVGGLYDPSSPSYIPGLGV